MTPTFRHLETHALRCPLGVRFRDAATGALVGGGLTVTAAPVGEEWLAVTAVPSASGVYAFHRLPRLRRGDDGNAVGPGRTFRVVVRDDLRRFLPTRFDTVVPVDGVFPWPGDPAGAVPLFPTPGRLAPTGFAAVRAELWDPVLRAPARAVVLDVASEGRRLGTGVADDRGRVVVLFAYPPPPTPDVGSPHGSPLAPFPDREWRVALAARYARGTVTTPPPDVRDVLGQGPAVLWADFAAARPLGEQTLTYGPELVVRGAADPAVPPGAVPVTPAGSPL